MHIPTVNRYGLSVHFFFFPVYNITHEIKNIKENYKKINKKRLEGIIPLKLEAYECDNQCRFYYYAYK